MKWTVHLDEDFPSRPSDLVTNRWKSSSLMPTSQTSLGSGAPRAAASVEWSAPVVFYKNFATSTTRKEKTQCMYTVHIIILQLCQERPGKAITTANLHVGRTAVPIFCLCSFHPLDNFIAFKRFCSVSVPFLQRSTANFITKDWQSARRPD